MYNQTYSVSLKLSLGDYDMCEYFGGGESAKDAEIHLREMMSQFPPEKLKSIAIQTRMNIKQKAAESITF